MRRGVVTGILIAAAMSLGAESVNAQRNPKGRFDVSFVAVDAVGDLGFFFDQGFGVQLGGALPIDGTGLVRLRMDAGFLIYGLERQHHCFSLPFGCRIQTALTTTNNIAYFGMGPELVLARGPIEPYVFATMGTAVFFTTSSLEDDWDDHFTTTHMADWNWAWRAGGGLRMRVKGGYKPIFIDFGVERHDNGVAEFLTKGDIEDHADGSITIYPNRSQAEMLTFRFGVSFGVR